MADKGIFQLKKEVDEMAAKQKLFHEGIAAGIEEMIARAENREVKEAMIRSGVAIFRQLAESNRNLAEETEQMLDKALAKSGK